MCAVLEEVIPKTFIVTLSTVKVCKQSPSECKHQLFVQKKKTGVHLFIEA
jgi:hypothetical protein